MLSQCYCHVILMFIEFRDNVSLAKKKVALRSEEIQKTEINFKWTEMDRNGPKWTETDPWPL